VSGQLNIEFSSENSRHALRAVPNAFLYSHFELVSGLHEFAKNPKINQK